MRGRFRIVVGTGMAVIGGGLAIWVGVHQNQSLAGLGALSLFIILGGLLALAGIGIALPRLRILPAVRGAEPSRRTAVLSLLAMALLVVAAWRSAVICGIGIGGGYLYVEYPYGMVMVDNTDRMTFPNSHEPRYRRDVIAAFEGMWTQATASRSSDELTAAGKLAAAVHSMRKSEQVETAAVLCLVLVSLLCLRGRGSRAIAAG